MTDPEPTQLVPLGKYKGQPVEVLLADDGYKDWLLSQAWLKERFATFYQALINYGGQPQDSPEHNEFQASFLDDERCLALLRLLMPGKNLTSKPAYAKATETLDGLWAYCEISAHDEPDVVDRKFEDSGWDVTYYAIPGDVVVTLQRLPICACGRTTSPTTRWHANEECPWRHLPSNDATRDLFRYGSTEFYGPDSPMIRVELKPDLGDDFPTVLRQVLRYPSNPRDRRCVLVRRFSCERVTWEQVSSMFQASGIRLVMESELS